MSNNNDGQGFDDWFASNFGNEPDKGEPQQPGPEQPGPEQPAARPEQGPQDAGGPQTGAPGQGGPASAPPHQPWVQQPPPQHAPWSQQPPPVVPQQPVPPPHTPQYPTQHQPLQPPAEHWQQPPAAPPSWSPPLPDYGAAASPQQPAGAQPHGSQVPGEPQQTPTTAQPAHPSFDPALAGQDAPTEFIPSANQPAAGTGADGGALDALFGDDKFRDYEGEPPTPPTRGGGTGGDGGDEPPKGISRTHITLMWVAGAAVAALALFAFFLVGTRLPMLTGGDAAPSASPEPTEAELPEGPVPPGTYNWNELLGGECLDDYRGAWENEYTVVDCEVPHEAQLVLRAPVPVAPGTGGAYPGVYDLQSRMSLLCTDASVIDYSAANTYDDMQFEASFPPSVEEWDAGRRDYFCFVSRASGEPIEGSLAAPPSPDEPATDEETEDGTGGDGQ